MQEDFHVYLVAPTELSFFLSFSSYHFLTLYRDQSSLNSSNSHAFHAYYATLYCVSDTNSSTPNKSDYSKSISLEPYNSFPCRTHKCSLLHSGKEILEYFPGPLCGQARFFSTMSCMITLLVNDLLHTIAKLHVGGQSLSCPFSELK